MISIGFNNDIRLVLVLRQIKYGTTVSVEFNGEPTPTKCWFSSDTIEYTDQYVIVRHLVQLLVVLSQLEDSFEFIHDYWLSDEE